MGVVYHQGRTSLFAHVPKAGGTSIEALLRERFGTLHLHDPKWQNRRLDRSALPWSPQHIPARNLALFYPESAVDYAFAVVREPLARCVSSFRFQSNGGTREKLREAVGFSAWLRLFLGASRRYPLFSDNHFRPQTEIVPDYAEVFKLEDGLDRVAAALDRRYFDGQGSPAPHTNASHGALPEICREDVALIVEHYRADYERFGYEVPDLDRFAPRRDFVAPDWALRLGADVLAGLYRHRFIG